MPDSSKAPSDASEGFVFNPVLFNILIKHWSDYRYMDRCRWREVESMNYPGRQNQDSPESLQCLVIMKKWRKKSHI